MSEKEEIIINCSGYKTPELIQSGDKRVLINGTPLLVNARIVAEDNYKILIGHISSLQSEVERLKKDKEGLLKDCKKFEELRYKELEENAKLFLENTQQKAEIERLNSSVSSEGVKPVKIRFYKHDDLQGFAAYLSPSVKKDEHGIVLLDIEASLSTALEHEIPFKELLVENMMHEFGHALEEFYDLEFSEDRIEGIIESYRKKYAEFPPSPPVVEEEKKEECHCSVVFTSSGTHCSKCKGTL